MALLPASHAVLPASASQAASPPTLSLRVSTRTRAMRPGEVVLITVTSSKPIAAIAAKAFDKPVLFWESGDHDEQATWQALVGIPVATKAGTRTIAIEARTPEGETARRLVRLRVAASRFATRRLSVDPRFADPPASVEARIAEESKALADVLSAPPTPRIWRGAFSARSPAPPRAASDASASSTRPAAAGTWAWTCARAGRGAGFHAPNHGARGARRRPLPVGQTVVVDHGVLSLSRTCRIAVAVATVAPGAPTGEAGPRRGRVTGPHLHWAMRVGGTSVNPLRSWRSSNATPRRSAEADRTR